jgi:hypothetical protein
MGQRSSPDLDSRTVRQRNNACRAPDHAVYQMLRRHEAFDAQRFWNGEPGAKLAAGRAAKAKGSARSRAKV